jgi:lipase chaperone LimK
MTVVEERMQILKMIEQGQITAEEGARLLHALQAQAPEEAQPSERGKQPRHLRVRVTDLQTGQQKFDIDLPWNLVGVGMNMGARLAPVDVDLETIVEAVDQGAQGKIMDVVDEEDQERVEIFVE